MYSPQHYAAGNGKDIEEDIRKWLAEQNNNIDQCNMINQPLYHYTDMTGLVGILQTRTVWMTNSRQLNDPSEFKHGFDIAVRLLDDWQDVGTEIVKHFCNQLKQRLIAAFDIMGVFVASFSFEEDDLSQWRAYADDGRGVSLAIAPEMFKIGSEVPEDTAARFGLAIVRYGDAELRASIGATISKAIEGAEAFAERTSAVAERNMFAYHLADLVSAPILISIAYAKHEAYEREREARLIIGRVIPQLASKIRTRISGPNLVQYIPAPFDLSTDGALEQILVGPAAALRAEDAVRLLLLSLGYPHLVVDRSPIPYRPPTLTCA